MDGLQRHRLVWLHAAGWQRLLAQPRDPQAQACLAHWAAHDGPLVVARQGAGDGGPLALGLSAPLAWGRRKLALSVAREGVARLGDFPLAAAVGPLLPVAVRARWQALADALAALGATARVHGSHGWQLLSGLPHLREGSDLDVHVTVPDAPTADAVAARLVALDWPGPRLDGELVFASGAAVAWREWRDWRAGRCAQVMVKRLAGVTLEREVGGFAPRAVERRGEGVGA